VSAKNCGALRHSTHAGGLFFALSLCRLFSLTSFIHFNPFEAGDEPFDGLALDTAGSSTRSKNIISARPRIITLRSGPKNDRHPTSFNHGIMKVDFFHQLSLSRSATRDAAATVIICWEKCLRAKLASSRLTVNLILRNPRRSL